MIKPDSAQIPALIKELCTQVALSEIRSRDCSFISQKIAKKLQESVSEKTLLRLIGVDKSGSIISKSTLNIIARFLDYDSYHHFCQSAAPEQAFLFSDPLEVMSEFVLQVHNEQKINLDQMYRICRKYYQHENLYFLFPQIVDAAFRYKDWAFLEHLFLLPNIYEGRKYYDSKFWFLMLSVGIRLRQDDEMRDHLIPIWAAHTNAQLFYFEFFVDMDNVVMHYHKSINQYLLHKQTPEAKLFGNCILFFNAFVNNDANCCKLHLDEINKIELSNNVNPIPVGRKIVSNMLYNHFWGGGVTEAYIEEVLATENTICTYEKGTKNFTFNLFYIFVMDACVLTKHYELGVKLGDLATKRFKFKESYLVSFEAFYLFYGASQWFSGNKKAGDINLRKVHNLQHTLFFKQYVDMRMHTIYAEKLEVNKLYHQKYALEIAKNKGYKLFEEMMRQDFPSF